MSTCYNPFSLDGKTVLVTGASSGIGKATALECSRMGARLIINGRNEERLAETLSMLEGEGHKMVVADLTEDEGLKALVAEIESLDGVVMCQGTGDTVPVQFATRKKFDRVFDTNFFSQVELVRLLQKGKKFNIGASIVPIASIAGIYVINYGNGIYGASKAALASWVKFLALELAVKKIRVNAICPGMVETPFINSGVFSDESREKDIERYPMRRYGEPQEVALSVVYFLSDATKWVTGTNFVIDGGYSI